MIQRSLFWICMALNMLFTVTNSCVENIHITLGDHFTDSTSNIFYRVGMMVKDQSLDGCLDDVGIKLTYADGKNHTYQVTSRKRYSYHDWARPDKHVEGSNDTRVNYDRTFAFADVIDPEDPQKFIYEIIYKGEVVKGPFNFKTNLLNADNPYKIVSFGDHDLANGMQTIDTVSKRDYDLLLLLGDYAYDIYEDDGKKGDEYFAAMEKLMTKAPIILATGNHERTDTFQMFAARFQFAQIENDLSKYGVFYHKVRNTLIVTYNWDYVFLSNENFDKSFHFLEKTLISHENDPEIKFRLFVSHRALVCSYINQPADDFKPECQTQIFYQKPVEELLVKYGVDFVLSGHIHYYERIAPMFNYQIDTTSPVQIVAGSGGTIHYFDEEPVPKIEYQKKIFQATPGFLELSIHTNTFICAFIKSETSKELDRYSIYKLKPIFTITSLLINLFVMLVLLSFLTLVLVRTCSYKGIKKKLISNLEFKNAIDRYNFSADTSTKDSFGIVIEPYMDK